MNACYIIYSSSFDRYYTGATHDSVFNRLQKHNDKKYGSAATAFANDWEIFLIIESESYTMALNIEKHIKKMKSKSYFQNLKKYPEMISKLKSKYST